MVQRAALGAFGPDLGLTYVTAPAAGAWEDYWYDALGRRVLARERRGDLSTETYRRDVADRFVWDGDQLLYELRIPADNPDLAPAARSSGVSVTTVRSTAIGPPSLPVTATWSVCVSFCLPSQICIVGLLRCSRHDRPGQGVLAPRSTEAASRSTLDSSKPAAGSTATSRGFPSVSEPVSSLSADQPGFGYPTRCDGT